MLFSDENVPRNAKMPSKGHEKAEKGAVTGGGAKWG
jgi:hypothetical protein